MASGESHASCGHELELSQFVRSLEEKIACDGKNCLLSTDNLLAGEGEGERERERERIHIMARVPDVLHQQNENAYSPTTISIGPLHRGTQRLQPMEPVKWSYMCALLHRTTTFEETMKDCADAMLRLEQDVRNRYEPARLQPNNENFRLAEVMLIDGCFIIELLFRNFNNDYDPILGNPFKYYAVHYDLLLLENQIPFFVLEELFELMEGRIQIPHPPLIKCVHLFFGNILGLEKYGTTNMVSERPYHILHLLHIQYLPRCTDEAYIQRFVYDETEKLESDEMENKINYSATELRLGGVELKAGKHRNLFDIRFTTASTLFRKGDLEIPPFSISDFTESFLRNLIAFELSCPWINSYFTSLAFLMDLLINTPEDVKLFEEAGIIRNHLGSREEVARLFNGICKNASLSGFHYSMQYKHAMDFCKPWRVSIGRLKHDYFRNRWSGISVIAAIILFTLAMLQTLYAILSYLEEDKSAPPPPPN